MLLPKEVNAVNFLWKSALFASVLFYIYSEFPIFENIADLFNSRLESHELIYIADVTFLKSNSYKITSINIKNEDSLKHLKMRTSGSDIDKLERIYIQKGLIKNIPGNEIYLLKKKREKAGSFYFPTTFKEDTFGPMASIMYDFWNWPIIIPYILYIFFSVLDHVMYVAIWIISIFFAIKQFFKALNSDD